MKSLLAAGSILIALAAGVLAPPPSVSAQAQRQDWQRVHGKVEKVEGTTLTFKGMTGAP